MSENSTSAPGIDARDPAAEARDPTPDAAEEREPTPDAAEEREPTPAELARAERIEGLRETLAVEEGETLERAYLFEPLERQDVAFRLALVVKRVDADRLEMVAIGARAVGTEAPVSDFVRRARFPDPVLPSILEEFIDRCGVEGSVYRELSLADARSERGEPVDPFTALADALYPA